MTQTGAVLAEDIGYPVMIKASSGAAEKGCGLLDR